MAVETNRQLIIDSNFFVPKGVVDMRQVDNSDAENLGTYTPDTTAVQGPILDIPAATVPMPPTNYSIVDQHVRISPDGTTVVDVTVEFPDVEGINSIDVRITKST